MDNPMTRHDPISWSVPLALAGLLLTAHPAKAHRVEFHCTRQEQLVVVEVFYDDGTLAEKAKVEVAGPEGKLIATGRTDHQGRWAFPLPEPGRYTIKVDAGAGHGQTRTITIGATPDPLDPEGARLWSEANNSETSLLDEGPSRAEVSKTPWTRVILGLGIIAVVAGLFWLIRHDRNRLRPQSPAGEDGEKSEKP